jgi:hypothetical protein
VAPDSNLTAMSNATSYLQNDFVMVDSGHCSGDFSVQSTVIFDGRKNESEMIGQQNLENIQIGSSFAPEQVTEDGQTDNVLLQSTSSYLTASKNEFMKSRNFLLDLQSNLDNGATVKLLPQKDDQTWRENQSICVNFVDDISNTEPFLKSVEGVNQALATVIPVGSYEDRKEDNSSVFSPFIVDSTFKDFQVSEESDFTSQSQVRKKPRCQTTNAINDKYFIYQRALVNTIE